MSQTNVSFFDFFVRFYFFGEQEDAKEPQLCPVNLVHTFRRKWCQGSNLAVICDATTRDLTRFLLNFNQVIDGILSDYMSISVNESNIRYADR